MTKILITGSSGFIGQHLQKALSKLRVTVYSVDLVNGDVADPETWKAYPQADILIHLAAKSFVPNSWNQPADYIHCNVMGTTHALDYCKNNGAKIIFLSSYLYGNPDILPIPESAKLEPTNPYALSKRIGEELCEFYCEKFNQDAIVLRPFNVYGPGQPESFLIPEIIHQVRNNKKIILNDLGPKRDYIYVGDLVNAILNVIDKKLKGFSVFNIGSGISYSVQEVVNMIQEINHSNKPVVSKNERRRNEIMNTIADIRKAKTELAWDINWSLYDGLAELMSYNNI